MKTRDERLDFLAANNDLLRRRFHLTKIGLSVHSPETNKIPTVMLTFWLK